MSLEYLVAGLVVTTSLTLLTAAPIWLLISLPRRNPPTPPRRDVPPVGRRNLEAPLVPRRYDPPAGQVLHEDIRAQQAWQRAELGTLRHEYAQRANDLRQASIPSGNLRSHGSVVEAAGQRSTNCSVGKTYGAPFYRPIQGNWIRLFILERGERADPIKGQLITQPLNPRKHDRVKHCATYDALSYVWGHPSSTSVAQIGYRDVRIAANLESALRRLRSKWRSRALWIDAICIDQSNSEEKHHQISLMPDIYHHAIQVHMWLGEASDNSLLGMKVLSFLTGILDIQGEAPWTKYPPGLIRVSLDDILNRDYFKRTWVVLEVALSRRARMWIGKHSLIWDAGLPTLRFVKRMKFVAVWPKWHQLGLENVNMQPLIELLELSLRSGTHFDARRVDQPDVLDLMYDLRHRHVTDPRDKIYALLRLVPDATDLSPDYSLSVEETFQKLYRHIEKKYFANMLTPEHPWYFFVRFWKLLEFKFDIGRSNSPTPNRI